MHSIISEIEGMCAARDGEALDANPYPVGTENNRAWANGFMHIAEG